MAVIAPAGPAEASRVAAGLAVLREEGLVPRVIPPVPGATPYLAADDGDRRRDLQAAIADPDARAIWCVRGGYGTARAAEGLSLDGLRDRPRIVLGFSDITALLLQVVRAGGVAFHGPVVTQLGVLEPGARRHLFDLLGGRTDRIPLRDDAVALRGGAADGPLLGGNLTVLTSLVGTPLMPSLRGAIVVLEDVGEPAYRLDRMLHQLRMAGALEGVRGLLLGRFDGADTGELAGLLREVATWIDGPVVHGVALGHAPDNHAVPLGVAVRLDAARPFVRLLEAAVSS